VIPQSFQPILVFAFDTTKLRRNNRREQVHLTENRPIINGISLPYFYLILAGKHLIFTRKCYKLSSLSSFLYILIFLAEFAFNFDLHLHKINSKQITLSIIMKKLLIFSNLFWISVILFPAFIKPTQPNTSAAGSSYHLIDASLVKIMTENYRDFYVNTFIKKRPTAAGTVILDKSNGSQNNIDSRSIWFSANKIREFMNDMERESLSHGDSLSGIRFYYIKYPEKKIWDLYGYFRASELPQSYQNRHSLMLVPTYFNKITQFQTDFDPRSYDSLTKTYPDMATVMETLIKRENQETKGFSRPGLIAGKAAISAPDNSGSNASMANGGGLIPPYPPAGSEKMESPRLQLLINVPCSGADLMVYVDGHIKCGQTIKASSSTSVNKAIK
jgi:hypothetical protein